MKKIGILTVIASLFTSTFFAQQFEVSAEIRPRFENKHGYKTLLLSNADGSNFISQRTRLNLHFNYEKLAIGLSYQNVRAWAETRISDHFSVRLGRQEIVYDDSRIFGNVGWAQQARSHDALLAKFTWNNSRLDIGFALNADNQSEIATLYSNVAGYKAFQYAWYHTNINNVSLSLLAVNNGVEFLNTRLEKEVNYSQTLGGRLTTNLVGFNIDGAAYIQTGNLKGNTVSTSYVGGNINYKTSGKITLGIGAEYLSGKDMNATSTTIKSFAPLYGTNHKFNGWMDYFYVGNHKNSVGLTDINATFAYKKGKFSANVIPHLFYAAADVYDGTTKMDSNLGTEIDATLGYKISSNSSVNIGYSKLFATNAMEVLKGGDSNENNSWAWVMFSFKPTLFFSK